MLHDASALIIEGCPVIGFLHIALLCMGQLCFKDIRVGIQSFSCNCAQHSSKAMGRMSPFEPHAAKSFTHCFSVHVIRFLLCDWRKNILRAIGKWLHITQHTDSLFWKRDNMCVSRLHHGSW